MLSEHGLTRVALCYKSLVGPQRPTMCSLQIDLFVLPILPTLGDSSDLSYYLATLARWHLQASVKASLASELLSLDLRDSKASLAMGRRLGLRSLLRWVGWCMAVRFNYNASLEKVRQQANACLRQTTKECSPRS